MAEKLSERLEAVREALDSMDDFARMEASINPIGPRKVLEDFIEAAAELARRFEDAPKVEITACNQISGAKDVDHGDLEAAVQKFKVGQRVRLVPEAGQEVGK